MSKEIEIYDENEFRSKHNALWRAIWNILNGIPGEWELSQYTVNIYEDVIGPSNVTYHMIVFNDLNDEDRTFTMDWDNEDIPFEKAHIEVATD